MPLAWAASTLVVLGHCARSAGQDGLGALCELLLGLLLCGCLRLAWKRCLGAQAGRGARRAIALLIALAVPIQGFAAISMETRGPAHFHAGDASGAHHWHGDVEHHHHAADASAVEISNGDDRRNVAAAGENKRAASGALDTLMTAAFVFPSRFGPGALPADHQARRTAHVPGMPERPPRLSGDLFQVEKS
jgi:hypothetical protein